MREHKIPTLNYRPGDRACPMEGPQVITAEPFVQIAPGRSVHLEGVCFDRNGDLYVSNIYEAAVMKVDMKTREVTKFAEVADKRFSLAAIKIHRDGRFFLCGVDMKSNPPGEHGGVIVLDPDGSNPRKIVSGMNIDDMVFDSRGGFYFTNYVGTCDDPVGTVEYMEPDLKEYHTVISGLAAPNGVALSTDGKILWVTTTHAGELWRIPLKDRFNTTIPYRFEGFLGPDSCSVDADDNLYVAMARQGQVLVFNPRGFLIAKIFTPHRAEGNQLGTTHPMVHPYRRELYISAHDLTGDAGANILCCGSFAKGNTNAYQFS